MRRTASPRLAGSGLSSITVTVAPASASVRARTRAEVDFPAPPFGLANTTTGTANPYDAENDWCHMTPHGATDIYMVQHGALCCTIIYVRFRGIASPHRT